MKTIHHTILTLLSTGVPLFACSDDPGAATETADTGDTTDTGAAEPATGPTFYRDVAPILQQHCQGCHAPGKIAPFSLMTYDETKGFAELVAMRTQDGSMPPWGALTTDECAPRFGWQHDTRLSTEQLAVLAAWADADTPEGDPADAPTGAPPAGDLTRVDLTLQPLKPFVASGDADQMICFVLDPKLTEDVWVNASKLVPGNLKIDHHAAIFIDPTGASLALANADGYYDCFGTVGVDDASLLTPWVPGGLPTVFPANAAARLGAGSMLVLQMHYHPGGLPAEPDVTRLELQFHPGVPEYMATFMPIGSPVPRPNGDGLQPGPGDADGIEFLIPAGVRDHTETTRRTVPTEFDGQPVPEMKVYSVQSHMHYVGVDEKITVERAQPLAGEPASECLLQTPQWDFNWQQTYTYDVPIEQLPTLRGGDVVTVRCTYDNSLENPALMQALLQQGLDAPHDVTYGETTLQEMCVGVLNTFVKL